MRSPEIQRRMQGLFNRVVTKLLKQNEKSIVPASNVCLYRGPNGLRCAIGHLITNAAYDPKIEGHIFSRRSVLRALRESGVVAPNGSEIRRLLGELQDTHDDIDTKNWRDRFRILAEEYNLKMPRTISKRS